MEKKFVIPELIIVQFIEDDIITASGEDDGSIDELGGNGGLD